MSDEQKAIHLVCEHIGGMTCSEMMERMSIEEFQGWIKYLSETRGGTKR